MIICHAATNSQGNLHLPPHTHTHLVTLCIVRKEKDNSPISFLLLVCFVVVVVACFLSTCLHLPKMNTKYKITYVFVFFIFFWGGGVWTIAKFEFLLYVLSVYIHIHIFLYVWFLSMYIYTYIYIYKEYCSILQIICLDRDAVRPKS